MPKQLDSETFVRSAADAIIAAGSDGTIISWNPAAERVFGFSAAEAIGSSLDLIIPERFRERHWQGYRDVMRTGETRYATDVLRVPAVHKNGNSISIAFTVSLIDSGGERVIAAIVRDETQRWQEERELRRRLNELEKNQSEGRK